MKMSIKLKLYCPQCNIIEQAFIEGIFDKLPKAKYHDYKEFITDDGIIGFDDCGGTHTIEEYNEYIKTGALVNE